MMLLKTNVLQGGSDLMIAQVSTTPNTRDVTLRRLYTITIKSKKYTI